MSIRELRSLGGNLLAQNPADLEYRTRSGRTRNQAVIAQQQARILRRRGMARVERAKKTARTILKSRMGTRPFVLQESFGGVWRVNKAKPFEDQRRYDYVAWVNSFIPQMTRKMRFELRTQGSYKVFSTVTP